MYIPFYHDNGFPPYLKKPNIHDYALSHSFLLADTGFNLNPIIAAIQLYRTDTITLS